MTILSMRGIRVAATLEAATSVRSSRANSKQPRPPVRATGWRMIEAEPSRVQRIVPDDADGPVVELMTHSRMRPP